ncbi:hypothetical protein IF188_06160 [Microbacterium sp. NEAU-LLC]|uniref:Chloride channel protein n=1 Tax=Microbacterium helvum TaxID=2773713 RepID=A0ABR8NKT1_9MICO|nr:hypothetical protein [Microbacterium helvum]MBD3941281.1 hypothetical protein [Microbacterium helvum]
MRRLRPREVLTTGGVIASVVMVVFGLGLIVLCVTLLVQELRAGTGIFETVGIAKPTPFWLALIGACLGILGGGKLALDSAGYLVRAARGELPRRDGSRPTRRTYVVRRASRHQRQVWARSAEARRQRDAGE